MAQALLALLKTLSGAGGGWIGVSAMAAAYGGLVVYLMSSQDIRYCFSVLELSGLGVVVATIAHHFRRS